LDAVHHTLDAVLDHLLNPYLSRQVPLTFQALFRNDQYLSESLIYDLLTINQPILPIKKPLSQLRVARRLES
ncbi:hypothetical protein, partial [Sporosarcina sp. SAFN-015]|uniref:hypothetical protein n=1 Tax=Sporosarcina sp. SAFN-015 TaxID=3387274 RepID=UPI003F7D4641